MRKGIERGVLRTKLERGEDETRVRGWLDVLDGALWNEESLCVLL